MSTFQTMISLVLLIFVLSVIVQAIQEVVKALLETKADVMEKVVEKFMGQHLTLQQVVEALRTRGLDITALEHFDRQDFRHLLDGIELGNAQLTNVVASAGATVQQVKDNIAGSYEAARAVFQKEYTTRNRLFVAAISFVVVITLNANIISLYQQVSVDAVVQQAIVGQAAKVQTDQSQGDLEQVYSKSRAQISRALRDYPVLIRTSKFPEDFRQHRSYSVLGLMLMGILVSMGAPFWNDVLKGMMGINNALNTGARRPA